MRFIKKILLFLNGVLVVSMLFTIYNFYSAQNSLHVFLQERNIYHRNRIKTTFVILDQKNHSTLLRILLQRQIHILWYKIEKDRTLAILKPASSTPDSLLILNNSNKKCNLLIKAP